MNKTRSHLHIFYFLKKINLIFSIFVIHFKFYFHYCILWDKMNKIRSYLYMFEIIFKINLIYSIFTYVYIYNKSRIMST
jgi:hypothetical protein